jgi:hypothetical protein
MVTTVVERGRRFDQRCAPGHRRLLPTDVHVVNRFGSSSATSCLGARRGTEYLEHSRKDFRVPVKPTATDASNCPVIVGQPRLTAKTGPKAPEMIMW